jgi:hypothetical protein
MCESVVTSRLLVGPILPGLHDGCGRVRGGQCVCESVVTVYVFLRTVLPRVYNRRSCMRGGLCMCESVDTSRLLVGPVLPGVHHCSGRVRSGQLLCRHDIASRVFCRQLLPVAGSDCRHAVSCRLLLRCHGLVDHLGLMHARLFLRAGLEHGHADAMYCRLLLPGRLVERHASRLRGGILHARGLLCREPGRSVQCGLFLSRGVVVGHTDRVPRRRLLPGPVVGNHCLHGGQIL